MAGVTGPCPSCQVLIQAPYPEIPGPADTRPSGQYPAESPHSVPVSIHQSPQLPQEPRAAVRPEPRQLPNRDEAMETHYRYRPEPSGDTAQRVDPRGRITRRRHSDRVLRLAVPLLFICMALGVIYTVKAFLQGDFGAKEAESTAPSEKVRPILPEEPGQTFEELTEGEASRSIPVGEPPMPDIRVGEGVDPQPQEPPVDDGEAALDLLERFLEMESLEDRLPVIETNLSETELRESVLAGKLPEARITVDIRETNSRERFVDFFYHVDFLEEGGRSNPQTMLVRKRGESPPKVVVDPLIDLFGGRFENYADGPKKDAGTFQVVISASSSCYEDIPGADKKFSLRILTRENTKEIAKAYCGRHSKIGRMLEDEISGISYGQAKACTVFMRWNVEEDPLRPFLEALDIKSLDWNP